MLAYNLRVGLAFRLIREQESPEMDEHEARMKASRAGAARIKAALDA